MVEKRTREEEQQQQEEQTRETEPGEEQVVSLKKLCRGLGIEEDGDEQHKESVINSLLLSGEAEDDEVLVLGSVDVQEELLSGVIKSLEDEINFSSGSSTPGYEEDFQPEPPAHPGLQPHVDFSYLLEASDDELGIVSCSSPALSEADLVPPAPVKGGGVGNILELLNGEVINLDFPELGEMGEVEDPSSNQEWLRRAVATLDMVTEVIGSGGAEFESLQQVLVEPPGL